MAEQSVEFPEPASNPAERLYELVRKARRLGDEPPARLWASVFEIELDREMQDDQKFFQIIDGLISLRELVDETEAGVRRLEFEEFYLAPFPVLRKVIFGSFSQLRGSQTGLTSGITEGHETLLRVIGSQWRKIEPEPVVDEKTLLEVRAEAHDLFESVKASDIDPGLKRLILSLAAEIEHSIQLYRIGGIEQLKEALALVQAKVKLNEETVEKAKTDEVTRGWLNRLYGVAVKLYGAIKFANDTRKTIENVTPFFGLIGSPGDIPKIDLEG